MSLIHVKDGGGSTMELLDVDGVRLCTFFRSPEEMATSVRELKNFRCRSDDIFVCASMKSGTHWVWEIISMLCNGNAERIPKSKVKNMLEATPSDNFKELPCPRVLNTHMFFKDMPTDLIKLKCKTVFVLRNPKDVIVSYYNHTVGLKAYKYDGKWEHFFELFMNGKLEYGSWFDYTREWYNVIQNSKDLNIHVVYYEDLKQNTLDEVKRIGNFLGIDNKNNLFEAITQKCQFDQMTKEKDTLLTTEIRETIFQDGYTMYRKGQHGDWMNWFTVAQSDYFDKVFKEKMVDVKFNFRFRPDQ